MKILLVEDDTAIARLVSETLTADNYTIDVASDGETGWQYIQRWEYDLVILDIILPKLDGLSICSLIRDREYKMSILLLTARGSNEEIIAGLDAGADDYLTKPFDLSLLVARVRALLRRDYSKQTSTYLNWSNLSLNTMSMQVTYNQKEIELRRKEYKLLELFLRHPGRVFTRDGILDHLWASEDSPSEGAVTNLIKDLRQRLKGAGIEEEIIETVYGLGYRLKKEPQKPKQKIQPEDKSIDKTKEAIEIASKWFLQSLPQRIKNLEEIEKKLRDATLTEEVRKTGEKEVHKLIGSLGTFGFSGAVDSVRQLENLLSKDFPLSQNELEDFSGHLNQLKATITEFLPAFSQENSPPEELSSQEVKTTALVVGQRSSSISISLRLLAPWGIHVVYLEEPDKFSELLAGISPDIFLIDTEFAAIDAIEFCYSIRRDSQWGDFPILALIGRTNPQFIQKLFTAGIDDFVIQPALGPELVSRVLNHTERVRFRRRREESKREIDLVTRLPNRIYFDRQTALIWSKLKKQQLPLAMIICEIDNFSLYNRLYGHNRGDFCLERVAKSIKNCLENKYFLARYGGASFAILLSETNLDVALKLAEKIQNVVFEFNSMSTTNDLLQSTMISNEYRLTLSMGISGAVPKPEQTISSLLNMVEQALNLAKWQGGNTYCLLPL